MNSKHKANVYLLCSILALVIFNSRFAFAEDFMATAPSPTPGTTATIDQQPITPTLPIAGLDPSVGPNVRVNSRVTCPTGQGVIQSETAIAMSGAAVVIAYNDFRGFYCADQAPGYQVTGWGYSLDGGQTFTDGGPLPGRTNLSGDPWLATGTDGTIYLASLWRGLSNLAVLRGTVTDTGIDWSQPTIISAGGAFDKDALTVDPISGTLYLTYTRFGGPGGIALQKSTDGGLSFQGPFSVAPGGVQGSNPAVGPNGEVYVAWNIGWPSQTGIGFAASLNGGETFSAARTVGQICNFPIPGLNRPNPAFPQLAVDTTGGPYNGNLYLVWHTACPRGNGDVVLIRSTDQGQTWSAPLVVNDDTTTAIHFYPTVRVDDSGKVNVFFYDRRENPGTVITNVYFAQSTNGGVSFNPNIKVTSVASEWRDPGEGTPNYGDYINSFATGTDAIVAYADGRDGDPDAYFIRVSAPLAR